MTTSKDTRRLTAEETEKLFGGRVRNVDAQVKMTEADLREAAEVERSGVRIEYRGHRVIVRPDRAAWAVAEVAGLPERAIALLRPVVQQRLDQFVRRCEKALKKKKHPPAHVCDAFAGDMLLWYALLAAEQPAGKTS